MTNSTIIDKTTPEALMRTFTACVVSADLDALLDLYEPDAVFEPQLGVVVTGYADIRAALGQLLALEPKMEANTVQVLRSGDIALVVNEWTMTGSAPDGTEVRQGGRSADVVRRQPDGSWRVVIDKP